MPIDFRYNISDNEFQIIRLLLENHKIILYKYPDKHLSQSKQMQISYNFSYELRIRFEYYLHKKNYI